MGKRMEKMKWKLGNILGLYWGYMGIMEKNMETTILTLFRPPYLLHKDDPKIGASSSEFLRVQGVGSEATGTLRV